MPKLNEFKLKSKGRFETTLAHCVTCDDVSLSFGHDVINVCAKCNEILSEGNCLVIEMMYQDEEKIIGGNCMILPKEAMNTESSIVCVDVEEFSKLYKIYMIKNN